MTPIVHISRTFGSLGKIDWLRFALRAIAITGISASSGLNVFRNKKIRITCYRMKAVSLV
ncbi:MAG: hypothetical protein V7K26_15975 [Nostoc sp.]|uniref:hypothetical protein n=1 Tax=Nostoc sp. TaxID=1180 RepID=UPI002FF0B816